MLPTTIGAQSYQCGLLLERRVGKRAIGEHVRDHKFAQLLYNVEGFLFVIDFDLLRASNGNPRLKAI